MSELRIDCEPAGDGEWHVFMAGHCDALAAAELLGAARGLVVVGARQVSLDLEGLEYLDVAGMVAIVDFNRALAACGTVVHVRPEAVLGISGSELVPVSHWFG